MVIIFSSSSENHRLIPTNSWRTRNSHLRSEWTGLQWIKLLTKTCNNSPSSLDLITLLLINHLNKLQVPTWLSWSNCLTSVWNDVTSTSLKHACAPCCFKYCRRVTVCVCVSREHHEIHNSELIGLYWLQRGGRAHAFTWLVMGEFCSCSSYTCCWFIV